MEISIFKRLLHQLCPEVTQLLLYSISKDVVTQAAQRYKKKKQRTQTRNLVISKCACNATRTVIIFNVKDAFWW